MTDIIKQYISQKVVDEFCVGNVIHQKWESVVQLESGEITTIYEEKESIFAVTPLSINGIDYPFVETLEFENPDDLQEENLIGSDFRYVPIFECQGKTKAS